MGLVSVANKHLTDMHDASVQSGRKAATPPKVAQGGGKRSAAAPYRGVGRQAPIARQRRAYGAQRPPIGAGVWGGKRRRRAASPLMCSAGVGIGTTAPTAALQIKSATTAIRISGNLTNASTRPAVSTTPGAFEIRGSGATDGADDGFLRLSAGSGSSANQQAYIDISGYSTVADMGSNIVFGAQGVERMRIVAGGNVGIGVTNPTYTLQLNTGSTTWLGGSLSTNYVTLGITAASVRNGSDWSYGGTYGGTGPYTWTTNIASGSYFTISTGITAGATYRVSFTASGTAGAVFGFESFSATLTTTLTTYTGLAPNLTSYGLYVNVYGPSGTVFTFSNITFQRLDTLATGFVGIGTTAPSVPLQVGTTSNSLYPNYTSTGAGSIIYSSYATIPSGSGSTSYSGNLTVFSTAAHARNSGGSIALGGLMYNFGGGNFVNSFARISGVQSNTTDSYDGDMVLESSNNGTMYERMRIKTNGFVGIGTTLPNATLHVNGVVRGGLFYSMGSVVVSLASGTNATSNPIPIGSIGIYLVAVTGFDGTYSYRKIAGTAIVSMYYDGGSYYTSSINVLSSYYMTFVSIANNGTITFNHTTGGTATMYLNALCLG